MSDKRAACRVRRRLPVTFSDGKPHRAITANLSRTGACIHSDYVVTPGTQLTLTLGLPGISDVHMEAMVEWAKKLRGSETLNAGHSMGLRYLSAPGPEYHDFMSLIEGLAQPHGLVTRQAPAAALAPPAPPPRGVAIDPRREPDARPTTPHSPRQTPARHARVPERVIDLDATPVAPRRSPAVDPRREPPRTPARVSFRRAPGSDPRREPDDDAAAGRRREVEVIDLHAPIVEVARQPAASAKSRPEKNLDFVVGANDLAAPDDYPCSLSTARVAWLLEQGAAELIAPRLKGRMTTVGLSLEVSVPNEPVAVGTPLDVVVALTALGSDRRTFVFELEIKAGDRLIASGRHVRQVAEPAA
jgi:predicted thioesterase